MKLTRLAVANFRLVVLALVTLAMLLAHAQAATSWYWGGAEASWQTNDWYYWVNNVQVFGTPASGDSAIIDNGGTVDVFGAQAGCLSLDINANENTGTTISALLVEGGGSLTNGIVYIGDGSAGMATVTGAGATWNVTTDLYAGTGWLGSGNLTISQGGTVNAQNGYVGAGAMRSSNDGLLANGTVIIQDAGSSWNLSVGLEVGGNGGVGTLILADGGSVTVAGGNGTIQVLQGVSASTLMIGTGGAAGAVHAGQIYLYGGQVIFNHNEANYVFSVPITGGGSLLHQGTGTTTITVQSFTTPYGEVDHGTLKVTGSATCGPDGGGFGDAALNIANNAGDNGTLVIQEGGTFTIPAGTIAGVGIANAPNSQGAIVVTGAGSTWNGSSGGLGIGGSGNGSFTISNGGTFNHGGTNTFWTDIYIGSQAGSTGTLTVCDAGSSWTNTSNTIYVAGSGTGTLKVLHGASMTSDGATIGSNVGSSGTATVSGSGSNWNVGGTLYLGSSGDGLLTISNGGVVTSGDQSTIGIGPGTGTASVTGSGSTWHITGNFDISDGGGTDSLTVTQGGIVTTDGWLWVGRYSGGQASLTISAGGIVNSSEGLIGGDQNTSGSANVTGTGSAWNMPGDLNINGSDANETAAHSLCISSGGVVTCNNVFVGTNGNGTNWLTIADANAALNASGEVDLGSGSLNLGTGGVAGTITATSIVGLQNTAFVNFNHTGSYSLALPLTGSLSVNKTGAGTTILSGNCNYTGATSVQAGQLLVNGSLGNTSVTVAGAATLGGTGTIAGPVAAAGTVAPGNPAGTLSTGPCSITGTLAVVINGATSDSLNVSGNLDISHAGLAVSVLGGGATAPVYVIATYSSLTGTQFQSISGTPAGYGIDYNYRGNQIALVPGGAQWPQNYSSYVQSLIAQNNWGVLEANAYLAFQSTLRTFPLGTGASLPPGTVDPNFYLVSQPAGATYGSTLQVIVPQGGYVLTPGAQYIAPQQDTEAPGVYDYQTTFHSNFAVPTRVVVSGAFAAEDSCVLQINGQGSYAAASNVSQLYPIYTSVVVPAGEQTTRLDFMVTNNGGPSGLLVSNLNIYVPPLGVLADNGFETPDLGGAYQYNPVCPNWGFIGNAGITSNGAGFNAQGATRGQASDGAVSTAGQAAFLQSADCSVTQYVNLPAGTYNVSFGWEARDTNNSNDITVSLGGNVLFEGHPTVSTNFTTVSTAYVTLPAGVYALTFAGTFVEDVTTYIDDVAVNNDPGPFVWQGGTGDFNDPANWGRNRPPGRADTATINSGSFTISGPIYAGTVIVNVPFAAPANADFAFYITGNWTFKQPVTFSAGYQFQFAGGGTVNFASGLNAPPLDNISLADNTSVAFSGLTDPSGIDNITVRGEGSVSFPGLASIVGINTIYAGNGSKLSFPNVAAYAAPNDTSASWQAENGGELDFPALVTITGPLRTLQDNAATLDIRADYSGVINFAALTTISEPAALVPNYGNNNGVILDADNSGQINAPLLNSFVDSGTINLSGYPPGSNLVAYSTGVLSLPQLFAPVGVQMNLNDLSNPGQFTSLAGTYTFQLNSGTVAMQVGNVTGLTFIYVQGAGTKLSFSNVASCTAPNDTNVTWQAENGGELDFPALVTITGPLRTLQDNAATLNIRADYSGVINFAALTTISEPAALVPNYGNNNGVILDADNSGQINAPLLNSFVDSGTINLSGYPPGSNLVAYSTGVLSLPQLLAPVGVQMNLNDLSNPGQFTSLAGTYTFQLNSGTVAMQVGNVTGLTFIYVQGAGTKLSFSNVTSFTAPDDTNVTWQAENGGELDFPALVTITGPLRTLQDNAATLNIRADYSGVINFAALTTISEPAALVPNYGNNNGVILDADNSGQINAPLLNSFVDSGTINLSGYPPGSNLVAYSAGVLSLPQLLAPVGVQMNLNDLSNPGQFTSLAGTYTFQLNSGTVAMQVGNVTGLTFIYVQGAGTKLSFSNVTSFTAPDDTNVTWQAENGGELDFPALVTITGPLRTLQDNAATLNIRADYSGVINFAALTTISEPAALVPNYGNNNGVILDADNSGQINAPLLNSFVDSGTINLSGYPPGSNLVAYSAGVLSLPQLLAPVGVQMNLNDLSNPGQFTSLAGAYTLQINSGTVTFTNVASISGLTHILITGGAKVSFPTVTNYTIPDGVRVTWEVAYNDGSELDFPNLTTITGNTTPESYLFLESHDGACLLSLPALTTITKPDDGDLYNDSGVQFYAYSRASISAPLLSTFHDNDSYPDSLLYATDTATLVFPQLLAPIGVNFNLNAQSNPGQFTSLVNTNLLQINSGAVTFANLASITGVAHIYITGGDKVSFPSVTSYTIPDGTRVIWEVAYNDGSELDFPNLTTITGNSTPGSYLSLYSHDGACLLNLPALTTIIKPDDGDQYYDSGVQFYAYSRGSISAPLLSTFDDFDSHPDSVLSIDGSGSAITLTSLNLGGVIGVRLVGITLPPAPVPAPAVTIVLNGDGNLKISVPTLSGHAYQLQQSASLSPPSWQNAGASQTGADEILDFIIAPSGAQGFYRVLITPWP